MKATGVTRRIDELGRVVLPVELRKNLGLLNETPIEIYVEEDRIILKKYEPTCFFCGSAENVLEFHDKLICRHCATELAQRLQEE